MLLLFLTNILVMRTRLCWRDELVVLLQFVCQCCSEPHQSQTSVSVQHRQPLSPPLSPSLSFPIICVHPSIFSLSPSSHTWKPAWLMPVRGTSFTMRTRAERRERKLPDKTHEHTQTHMYNYTHQFPLHGPEWVIEGEGLVTRILLQLPVSCRLSPLGTCKHTDPSCVHGMCAWCVCVCVFYFSCFELWLQEVPGLQPMVKGLRDPPSLQWGGIHAGRLPYH